jgi:hypothetical protein
VAASSKKLQERAADVSGADGAINHGAPPVAQSRGPR